MTVTDFHSYQTHLSNVDAASFIGSVVVFEVKDTKLPYNTAKARLEAVGLGSALPSTPPCDADVFRRVFSQGQRRRTVLSQDRVENLLVRDVAKSKERLVKHVVVEEVDQAGERLSYDEAIAITFEAARSHSVAISFITTSVSTTGAAYKLADELRDEYMNERGCLDSNGVRTLITKSLEECHAVALRDAGGVYFVSSIYDTQIEALEELARNIPGATVCSLPLIDDRRQRDMIKSAWRSEVTTDVERLMAEIADTLGQGDPISMRKFESFQTRYAKTMDKVKEYRHLLEDSVEDATLHLDLLARQVSAALGRVG